MIDCLVLVPMDEWTDEFISHAQQKLISMVNDWSYDYGVNDRACSAMLLWMILRLNPQAKIDANCLDS